MFGFPLFFIVPSLVFHWLFYGSHWKFLSLFFDLSLVLDNFHLLLFAFHCFFHWFSLVFLLFFFGTQLVFICFSTVPLVFL